MVLGVTPSAFHSPGLTAGCGVANRSNARSSVDRPGPEATAKPTNGWESMLPWVTGLPLASKKETVPCSLPGSGSHGGAPAAYAALPPPTRMPAASTTAAAVAIADLMRIFTCIFPFRCGSVGLHRPLLCLCDRPGSAVCQTEVGVPGSHACGGDERRVEWSGDEARRALEEGQ